jgi:hypothetical protein
MNAFLLAFCFLSILMRLQDAAGLLIVVASEVLNALQMSPLPY